MHRTPVSLPIRSVVGYGSQFIMLQPTAIYEALFIFLHAYTPARKHSRTHTYLPMHLQGTQSSVLSWNESLNLCTQILPLWSQDEERANVIAQHFHLKRSGLGVYLLRRYAGRRMKKNRPVSNGGTLRNRSLASATAVVLATCWNILGSRLQKTM